MPQSRLDELAAKVAAMDAVLTADDDASYAHAERDWNAGIVALRKNADWLIRVARAAEAATETYWGAGNELEAMEALRAALESR